MVHRHGVYHHAIYESVTPGYRVMTEAGRAFRSCGKTGAMKAVTLNGIKRRGLAEWKSREWWCRQNVLIWSREHCAWWRDMGKGYTDKMTEAWLVDFPTAYDYTKHCGPEKQIMYYALVTPADRPR
jgi:hypothetical protein